MRSCQTINVNEGIAIVSLYTSMSLAPEPIYLNLGDCFDPS